MHQRPPTSDLHEFIARADRGMPTYMMRVMCLGVCGVGLGSSVFQKVLGESPDFNGFCLLVIGIGLPLATLSVAARFRDPKTLRESLIAYDAGSCTLVYGAVCFLGALVSSTGGVATSILAGATLSTLIMRKSGWSARHLISRIEELRMEASAKRP